MRPTILTLSDETLRQVVEEAYGLLSDPGIRIENSEALQLLAAAGAHANRNSQVVAIPEKLVFQALETAPHAFDLYDIYGEPAVHYRGDAVHFDPGSAGITILDSHTGQHRPPVTDDFATFVRLVEMLPAINAQSTAMVCQDVIEEIGDLYRLYVALNFMTKPIVTGAFGKDTWWTMRELLLTVRGSQAELEAKPLAVFDVCPSPPLLWSDLTCQNLIDCARTGIPAELVSMPLAGATAPVTLAGAVVQHTAECLSGLVIHQLARPGSPLVWGGSPAAFDMRQGTTPMGAAETWLIDAAYVQVGKSLDLPTHVYMGMSDAKIVDAQCGLESMGGALVAALSGANMISGAGMLDFETCLSHEKLVIDAEIISLCKRVVRGVEIHEVPIALPLARQMGHKGEYLGNPHTRKWFRQEFHMPSEIIDRGSMDAWKMQGSRSTFDRAHERVRALLAEYQPTRLSAEIRQEIHSITLSAARKYGMRELPTLHHL